MLASWRCPRLAAESLLRTCAHVSPPYLLVLLYTIASASSLDSSLGSCFAAEGEASPLSLRLDAPALRSCKPPPGSSSPLIFNADSTILASSSFARDTAGSSKILTTALRFAASASLPPSLKPDI
mmetsp:Transcript_12657/g.40384  ORF Transcript_12657/g.40384 Transcript_12657/m.40384 type:complete len:125 (-) Transcript_12657:855-1229(-)